MVLFIFFALMYGVVQLFILSSLSRTTRWRSILFGFVAGMSASVSGAILIERGSALLFAAALRRPLSSVPVYNSYTLDPIVEEFCKVLPLLLVLLIPRVRTRLGLSDLVVISAALGSGFGFTETTLRFGYGAGAAHWSGGYWLISQGFSSVGIPGIGVTLRSWLPVGVTQVGLFSRPNVGLNTHLAWGAIVGLGIGIALRGRGKWKGIAFLLFIFACLDHATSNAAQLRVSFPFMLSPALAAMRHYAGFYVPISLSVAICLDRSVFKRSLADESMVTLPAERQGKLGMIALMLGHLRKPELLRDLWSYVLQKRAFAWSKAVNPSDESLPIDRARLVAMGAMLGRNGSMCSAAGVTPPSKTPSQAVYQRILPPRLQRFLFIIFAIPPLLFFVIGDFPSTARLQHASTTPIVFHTLICLLIACMIWQFVVLIGQASAFLYMRNNESAQSLMLHGLSLSTAVGALVFSIITLIVVPNHRPLQQIGQYCVLCNLLGSSPLASILTAFTVVETSVGTGIRNPLHRVFNSSLGQTLVGLPKDLSSVVSDGNTQAATSNFEKAVKSADPQWRPPKAGD